MSYLDYCKHCDRVVSWRRDAFGRTSAFEVGVHNLIPQENGPLEAMTLKGEFVRGFYAKTEGPNTIKARVLHRTQCPGIDKRHTEGQKEEYAYDLPF